MVGPEPDENGSSEAMGSRLSDIRCPALVVGVKSDVLFPVWQQRELATLLGDANVPVTYSEIDSPYGHDTFLIELDSLGGPVRTHLAS